MSSSFGDSGYVLAFDIGTTNVKAGLIDIESFRVVEKVTQKAEVLYPEHGYAEVSPDTLWRQVVSLAKELSSSKYYDDILGVVYSAHMAGVLPIDRDYNPLRNIIIWLDERAAGIPEEVFRGFPKVSGYNLFHLMTFLRLTGGAPSKTGKDPISKMLWIKRFESDIFRSTYKFIDVKGYLILRSTGAIVTSPDEAHLTWLADTRGSSVKWSEKLIRRYGLDISLFPEIKSSVDEAGYLKGDAASELGLKEGIPVFVGAGDLASAAVGSGAVGDYEPHIYVGSSSWIAAHVPKRLLDISHYMGSLASGIPGRYLYIAEQEVAGSALDYISGLVGVEGNYSILDEMAEEVEPGSKGLIFMPWMFGERAPIDDPYVRGGFINLGFDHDRRHLIRAVLEGVAYNIRWSLQYFRNKVSLGEGIKVVGGGIKSDLWCQILADVFNHPVVRMFEPENASLRGAGVFASIGLGKNRSFAEAVSKFGVDRVFRPDRDRSRIYDRFYSVFSSLYKNLKELYRELNA